MAEYRLIFIVGLTGVGKSSTLAALTLPEHITVLPNRRIITDEIVIPQAQRQLGEPVVRVTDRLERFRLTASYRKLFPGGMVHALSRYLSSHSELTGELIFDNIRGLQEVQAAFERFPGARFIVLDAPPLVRLTRLVSRKDSFDKVAAVRLENTSFIENLLMIEGITEVFDPYEVARFEATSSASDAEILDAVRIIVAEQRNYASEQVKAWLAPLAQDRRLIIDTAQAPVAAVASQIAAWL